MSNYQKSSTLAFGIVKLASDSTPESEASLPITNYTLGLRLAAFSGAATSTTSGVISLTSGTLNALSALVTNGILAKTAAGTVTTRSISIGGTGLSISNADGISGNPTITSNATNLNTVSTIVARDASGNFSAGTITAALSGNASTATKLATARTINGVAFDGTANITVADSTKLPLTGGVLTGGLCIGDGTAAKPNDAITGGLEHYLELRGTTATYPSALGVAFHHEGISTSALVHGQTDANTGYFDLRTDDQNLSVRFKGDEVWNSTYGSRGSKSAVGEFTGGDWNTLTKHGVYKIQHDTFAGDSNPPPSFQPYGVLVVEVSELGEESRTVQVYYPLNGDNFIFQRMFNNLGWTVWYKIWRGGTGDGSGLVSSKVSDTAPSGDGRNLVEATMATNDYFRIRAYSTAYDGGEVEIATADGGNEPIHVRQYTGLFDNVVHTLTLLDSNGNTTIPGITYGSSFTVSGNASGMHDGNTDGASSTGNNVKIASWYGIGFSPSISGMPVPYGEYSHWFNTRDGNAGMRGTLTQYSDIRLKENVEVIQDALAKTCSLRGIVYDRKDGGGRCTGVIAQEVQAVLPEAVTVAEDEVQTLSVAYGNMVGLLIEAIKELKWEVDNLKAEVALLKSA